MKKLMYILIIVILLLAIVIENTWIGMSVILPLGFLLFTNKKLQKGMGQFLNEIDEKY